MFLHRDHEAGLVIEQGFYSFLVSGVGGTKELLQTDHRGPTVMFCLCEYV